MPAGFSFSNSSSKPQLNDSRAGATDNALAVGGGRAASTTVAGAGGVSLNFAGLGSYTDKSRVVAVGDGAANAAANAASQPKPTPGNISVTNTITQYDPVAALAAIDQSGSVAELSIKSSESLAKDVLDRSTIAGEKLQNFAETTVSDAIKTVEKLALPANERGFNGLLIVGGAVAALYLYLKFKK